jgi:shikimate dehydrogenase
MPVARLAVLGSPIAHSLSPDLHRAAYAVLGLDWEYDAIQVKQGELKGFIRSLDSSCRGLSLTMPLKVEVFPLLDDLSPLTRETGSANTVLIDGGRLAGFNTDVFGLTTGFERQGRSRLDTVLILGGGATAASALVAARRLGAQTAFVGVRSPERAERIVDVGRALGLVPQVRRLDDLLEIDEPLDAVISTLPNGAAVDVLLDPDTIRGAALFDVAYSPWPTPLAAAWPGEFVIGGREMLVFQALQQVRVFVSGDPRTALDHEDEVLAAMLAAVRL